MLNIIGAIALLGALVPVLYVAIECIKSNEYMLAFGMFLMALALVGLIAMSLLGGF